MGNEKYTQKVIEAFQTAQQIAALHYNQEISSVHMLMGLTKEPEGLLATIFTACKTDLPMKNTGKRIKRTSVKMYKILRHPQRTRLAKKIKK